MAGSAFTQKGVSGYSGYSGVGTSGWSGVSGLAGSAASSGVSGYSGYSGKSGYSGSGVSGYSGYEGQDGSPGQDGTSGWSGVSGYGVGTSRYIILTAAGGSHTTTIGCDGPTKIEAGTNDIDYWALDFDSVTEERAFWNVMLPGDFPASNKLYARFIWTNASGLTTETVRWGVKGGSYSDSSAIEQALGTEITVDDTWTAQGDIHISAESSAITLSGSPNNNQYAVLNIGRKTASDNLTGDARLLMVYIRYSNVSE